MNLGIRLRSLDSCDWLTLYICERAFTNLNRLTNLHPPLLHPKAEDMKTPPYVSHDTSSHMRFLFHLFLNLSAGLHSDAPESMKDCFIDFQWLHRVGSAFTLTAAICVMYVVKLNVKRKRILLFIIISYRLNVQAA